MSNIRQVSCGISSCGKTMLFDVDKIKRPLSNKITCSSCGKTWVASVAASCCHLSIKFVSVEAGNKKPISFIKTFPKR